MKQRHKETLQVAIRALQHAENCMYKVYIDMPLGEGEQFRVYGESIEALWKGIRAELEQDESDSGSE